VPGNDRTLARRLRQLSKKIEAARAQQSAANDNQPGAPITSGLTRALGMSAELVGAVGFGVGIGLLIDWWLGSSPLALIVFFFLGFAAGVVNLVRAAQRQ
jgi:ATP synthase protein I